MGDRVAVWIVAELHLMFAAFVLGVPVREIVKDGDGEEREADNQRIAKRSVDDHPTALKRKWGRRCRSPANLALPRLSGVQERCNGSDTRR